MRSVSNCGVGGMADILVQFDTEEWVMKDVFLVILLLHPLVSRPSNNPIPKPYFLQLCKKNSTIDCHN